MSNLLNRVILDERPREQWPRLLRGDVSWGTERMMQEAERRAWPYLFRLKKSGQVNRHIEKLFGRQDGVRAGAGWEAIASQLQIDGMEPGAAGGGMATAVAR